MVRLAPLLALLAAPAFAGETTYVLDPAKTELLAFTEPTGVFKGASHSHVVRAAKGVSGKIVYDADAIGSSSVAVSFPVSGLAVDEPDMRKREGLTKPLSEKDRKSISESMRSEKQLDEKRFGQISFESTKVVSKGEGKLEVTGRMAIHGVKRNITLPISYTVNDGVFTGQGTYTFDHKDFGLEPFVAVLGTVRNAEPIRLKIRLVGSEKAGEKKAEAPSSEQPSGGGP